MRVLITGHNGYIGSVMVSIFQKAGVEVVGLDTFYFADGTLEPDIVRVPTIRKDIRDISPDDLTGFDAICHLAALCNDPIGDLNAHWTYDINHLASVQLATLAKQAGISRFLYSSSCSMYGSASPDDVLTETAPLNPLTPYAISKVRTEEDLHKLADSNFSPVYMRNATVYGASPRLRADVVLNNLTCWAYTTGKIRIMSDGTPWRPIVHVQDVASAFLAFLTAPIDKIHDQAFNIGVNGENYQVRDLAEIVRMTVPGCEVEYAGQGGSDPRNYRVDFTKVAEAIDTFKPAWNAQLGAQELYEAFQRARLTQEDFQGRKYIRLNQLKYLIETDCLDDTLRWKTA
jgi:nucleoside-diphosphate-sugar epimerase